ncbi:MAG: FHA domain-containing protein, partial [Planctomycetota bacterium]
CLYLQDFASTSGTFVNGTKIDDRTQVTASDEIRIGQYTIEVVTAESGSRDKVESHEEVEAPVAEPELVAVAEPTVVPATLDGDISDDIGPADWQQDQEECENELTTPSDDLISPDTTSAAFPTAQPDANVSPRRAGPFVNESTSPIDSFSPPSPQNAPEPHDSAADELKSDLQALANDPFQPGEDAWSSGSDSFDIETDDFTEEGFDSETINILRNEVDNLQSLLVQREAELEATKSSTESSETPGVCDEESSRLLGRVQDLLDEAECHDERVGVLEDLLNASEHATRDEQEERAQLESWVGSIESRFEKLESQWKAELESMNKQMLAAIAERDRVQRMLKDAASQGSAAPQQFEETLERLQEENRHLADDLRRAQRERDQLSHQVDEADAQAEEKIREDRAALAKERAAISRLRFELTQKLAAIDEMPAPKEAPDAAYNVKLTALREHLREIHQQEKEEREANGENSLASRIKRLWTRADEF